MAPESELSAAALLRRFAAALDNDVFKPIRGKQVPQPCFVRAVPAGRAQSGSLDGYVWEVVSAIEPDLTSKTKI